MYYTRAGAGVSDEIAVATSRDGRNWEQRGVAIPRGAAGAWDAFAVGRPAVLHLHVILAWRTLGDDQADPDDADPRVNLLLSKRF